jgi:hypothetical protein
MILPGLDRQDWDKDMLVGDELADALTEYAAIVARIGSGDRVKINAFSAIGESTEVTVVFTAATAIVAESVHSQLPELDNEEVTASLRRRSSAIMDPPNALDESDDEQSWMREMDQ